MPRKGRSRPFELLVIGAVVALSSACSASGGATPTPTGPFSASTPSSSSPTATSTSSPAAVLSSVTETNPPVASTSHVTKTNPTLSSAPPRSADLTPDQVAAAQPAIAAYTGYWAAVDLAAADPGADWTSQVSQYATGAELDSFLESLRQAAARGQRATGTTKIDPQVTAVAPGLVTISDCVDKTYTDYLQGDVSIKAPDAPGSYFRHPAVVQVAQFNGGRWLVMGTSDDWSKTC